MGYTKPTGEDELRSSLGKALRAKRKRQQGDKPPAAAEEIAPGKYRESPPEGQDSGMRLASARRRAKIAKIRGGVA